MRILLLVLYTSIALDAFGQSLTYPELKQAGKTINDFVPAGWVILDKASGDMNGDKLSDVALVLQHRDSITFTTIDNGDTVTVTTQPRILALLFKNPKNDGYHLVQQSNTFILPHDNPTMEDPYQSITIKEGVLNIRFQLFANIGSWEITNGEYKFRYRNKQFELIGAETYSMNRANGKYESYSYNFLMQKRSFTQGDPKRKYAPKWKNINVPLNTLAGFKRPFEWQIEEDVYL
jgi:hypothetical protein